MLVADSVLRAVMRRRLKDNLKNSPRLHHRTHLQNMELEWAHVFHDSIRGKSWLESLPLNIGRWAGNYSYFYVLCRLLNDYQPARIIEFGVGESSKVVSAFLKNQLLESRHVILEEDEHWAAAFLDRFTLCDRSEIKLLPITEKHTSDGVPYNGYTEVESLVQETKYDLYLVDGPKGSSHCSRYDIVVAMKAMEVGDEFIVLIDDHNRIGEQETAERLQQLLRDKGLTIFSGQYIGNSSQIIIATPKYRFATTL